ncbi:trimethyllysine dioxygenase, mitochondrial [Vanessa atalanta]|uniref:trimethyllysine dioxygenase, mitochondrial n=1 Tax=Vanessa atalanta TaxID=42275 RepID=UPI001FCD39F5|nr:trimethyllysine dioxygenase, mitochondrial [Vanessa atalanta]
MAVLETISVLDKVLTVKFRNGTSIAYEEFWLRDHCRCSTCYHADTFQRAHHLLQIPDVNISNVKYDKDQLTITWSDNHESVYKAEFLAEFSYDKWRDSRRLKPIMWSGGDVADKVTKIHVDEFLNSVNGAKAVFKSLLDYGVALIENVDVSVEATETVCNALGGVQHTMFGGMWEFTTTQDHADTAYTNLPLAVHNDNTYFTEAAGLQILHCLEHSSGSGGETLLVDGFYGATRLKNEHHEDFEFLTNFDVEAEYLEDGHHYRYSAPVIKLDKMKDITQIRFNVYDRSAMAFPNDEECRSYYRSLRNLSRYYENPEFQWKFKLKPGLVMVMDNFRVLHGRTGFNGKRVLCGSYVARSDWLNKARALRLIQ